MTLTFRLDVRLSGTPFDVSEIQLLGLLLVLAQDAATSAIRCCGTVRGTNDASRRVSVRPMATITSVVDAPV